MKAFRLIFARPAELRQNLTEFALAAETTRENR
jgi:hypothetical protein